jgi:hypothetical protein
MAIVKGKTDQLIRQPGARLQFGETASGDASWVGPYDLCLAQKPARGAGMAGFPGLIVLDSDIERLPGGMGRLVVQFDAASADDDQGPAAAQPTYEVYWVQQSLSLKFHPLYRPGGAKAIPQAGSPNDHFNIREWEASTTADEQTKAYYKLSDNAKHLVDKLAKGQDSFHFFLPVAVIVSRHMGAGNALPCGLRLADGAKPFPQCPAGYAWLLSGDRWARTGKRGKWVRTRTYNGYPWLDPDLYTLGPS